VWLRWDARLRKMRHARCACVVPVTWMAEAYLLSPAGLTPLCCWSPGANTHGGSRAAGCAQNKSDALKTKLYSKYGKLIMQSCAPAWPTRCLHASSHACLALLKKLSTQCSFVSTLSSSLAALLHTWLSCPVKQSGDAMCRARHCSLLHCQCGRCRDCRFECHKDSMSLPLVFARLVLLKDR
jgi:hypothetical protein